ncbi:hypothetical protein CH06BL_10050 [Chromobacterium haemolyticum]|nr:hypothetical protein CH06BL_10050 [Chromobacterium haemolyticum]
MRWLSHQGRKIRSQVWTAGALYHMGTLFTDSAHRQSGHMADLCSISLQFLLRHYLTRSGEQKSSLPTRPLSAMSILSQLCVASLWLSLVKL